MAYRVQLTIVAVFTIELNDRYSLTFIQFEVKVTNAVSYFSTRFLLENILIGVEYKVQEAGLVPA